MKRAIVIPARYASTRLPGKPLRSLSGKYILQWVYEAASMSQLKDEVLIATDDDRVRDAALSFGAEVVMTDPECGSGTERVYEAIRKRDFDIIVNLQGDEPFIRAEMIDALFSVIEAENLHMATFCTPILSVEEYMDPNTVKVVIDREGYALYFSRSPVPYLKDPQRIITAEADLYKHIGIYGFSYHFLKKYVAMEKSILEVRESLEQLRVLENGHKIRILSIYYDGFGIDTENDLQRAERVLSGSATCLQDQ